MRGKRSDQAMLAIPPKTLARIKELCQNYYDQTGECLAQKRLVEFMVKNLGQICIAKLIDIYREENSEDFQDLFDELELQGVFKND